MCKPQYILLLGLTMISVTEGESSVNSNSSNEILVGFLMRKPFVFRNEAGALEGLDVLMIENFAKKFNLHVNYLEYNTSTIELFNKEEIIENEIIK